MKTKCTFLGDYQIDELIKRGNEIFNEYKSRKFNSLDDIASYKEWQGSFAVDFKYFAGLDFEQIFKIFGKTYSSSDPDTKKVHDDFNKKLDEGAADYDTDFICFYPEEFVFNILELMGIYITLYSDINKRYELFKKHIIKHYKYNEKINETIDENRHILGIDFDELH